MSRAWSEWTCPCGQPVPVSPGGRVRVVGGAPWPDGVVPICSDACAQVAAVGRGFDGCLVIHRTPLEDVME